VLIAVLVLDFRLWNGHRSYLFSKGGRPFDQPATNEIEDEIEDENDDEWANSN
jgi:hypothetical protein